MAVYLDEDVELEVLPAACARAGRAAGAGAGAGAERPKYAPQKAIDFHTKITSKYYGDDYRATNGED